MKFHKLLLIIYLLSTPFSSKAQFAPQAPILGHEGIPRTHPTIKAWANACQTERGWINIADTALGKTSFGADASTIGIANGETVSLGDGGSAVLTFEYSIKNGAGPDFAIFENGFLDILDSSMAFLELAHVEVSSDGINFFRFPSECYIQDTLQIDNFGRSDAKYIHNLAGKYINGFGTPFDLEDMANISGLNIDSITHIKIIDVIGSIEPEIGTTDSKGNIINDPFPTPFPTGGFDLNAIAVLHQNAPEPTRIQTPKIKIAIYPNPASSQIVLNFGKETSAQYVVYNAIGQLMQTGIWTKKQPKINIEDLVSGNYYIQVSNEQYSGTKSFIKK